jgi:hypothetical protein
VFPNIEVRHLRAVVVLAEELNFTRATQRLRISQPALSKQVAEIEQQHRFDINVYRVESGGPRFRSQLNVR